MCLPRPICFWNYRHAQPGSGLPYIAAVGLPRFFTMVRNAGHGNYFKLPYFGVFASHEAWQAVIPSQMGGAGNLSRTASSHFRNASG